MKSVLYCTRQSLTETSQHIDRVPNRTFLATQSVQAYWPVVEECLLRMINSMLDVAAGSQTDIRDCSTIHFTISAESPELLT